MKSMSEADEKRYSAKEICHELATVAAALDNSDFGRQHRKALSMLCDIFLDRLLGTELYHQTVKELTQDLIDSLPGPEAAIMAAMMMTMRRDDDVAGDV